MHTRRLLFALSLIAACQPFRAIAGLEDRPRPFFSVPPVPGAEVSHFVQLAEKLDAKGLLTKMVPENSTTLEITALVPSCPKCGQKTSVLKPWNHFPLTAIDKVGCPNCGTLFPNADFPDDKVEKLVDPDGDVHPLRYYEGKDGKKHAFRCASNEKKYGWIVRALPLLAHAYRNTGEQKYARMYRDIMVQWARLLPDYVPGLRSRFETNRNGPGKPAPWPNVTPYYGSSKSNGYFHSKPHGNSDCYRLPHGLESYDLVADSPVWKELVPGEKLTAIEFVSEYFWGTYVKFVSAKENGIHYQGNLGGLFIGWPKMAAIWQNGYMAHNVYEWLRNRTLIETNYDYAATQGGNYCEVVKENNQEVLMDLVTIGYSDPRGFGLDVKTWGHWRSTFEHSAMSLKAPGVSRFDKGYLTPWRFPLVLDSAKHHRARTMMERGHLPLGDEDMMGQGNKRAIVPRLRYYVNQLNPATSVALGDGFPGKNIRAGLCFNHIRFHGMSEWLAFGLNINRRSVFGAGVSLTTRDLHGNSTAWANNTRMKAWETSGIVEDYTPHLPGVALVTVNGAPPGFNGYGNAYAIKRSLVLNTVDLDHPYVIDIIEFVPFAGKTISKYTYQLVGHRTTLSAHPGLKVKKGPSAISAFAKKGHRHVHMDVPRGRATWVDYRFNEAPTDGVRTHFLPQDDMEKDPIVDCFYFGGYGTHHRKLPVDKQAMQFQQELADGEDGRYVMVLVHDLLRGDRGAIRKVTRRSLAEGKALGLAVDHAGREDKYLLSFEGTRPLSYNGLSTNGRFAASVSKGKQSDLWLYKGTTVKMGDKELTQSAGVVRSPIHAVSRREQGAGSNSFLTDLPLAVGGVHKGDFLAVNYIDAAGKIVRSRRHRILRVTDEAGKRRIHIEGDTVFYYGPDKKVVEIRWAYPKDPFDDAMRVEAVFQYAASTVPVLKILPNTKPPYWVLSSMNDFEPVDGEGGRYQIELASPNRPKAKIHYTLDGSIPTTPSPVYSGPITVSGEQFIHAVATNPGGVMVPRLSMQRFRGRLPAVAAPKNAVEGLRYWGYDYKGIRAHDIPEETLRGRPVAKQHVIPASALSEHRELRQLYDQKPRRFEGYLRVPTSGLYSIALYFGDRLWIDDILLIDAATPGYGMWQESIALDKGHHSIRLEVYCQHSARPNTGLVWLKGPGFDWRGLNDSDCVCEPFPSPGTGFVTREIYEGIPGSLYRDLKDTEAYPGSPDGVTRYPGLNLAPYHRANYGERIRGFIHAPIDGQYTFAMRSQGESRFWLSSDASPANRRLQMEVLATTPRDRKGALRVPLSPVLALKAGEKYFFEIEHKEGEGNPRTFRLTWSIRGLSGGAVVASGDVPTQYLSELKDVPLVLKAKCAASAVFGPAPLKTEFDASASLGEISSYTWDFGDGTKGEGKSPKHIYTKNGVYTVTLSVSNAAGRTDRRSMDIVVASAMGINCGSSSAKCYVDSKGTVFVKDPTMERVSMKHHSFRGNAKPVKGGAAALYSSYASSVRTLYMPKQQLPRHYETGLHYKLPVQSGGYRIRLHLLEPEFDTPGSRFFNVHIEGKVRSRSVDIVRLAGGSSSLYVLDIPNVSVEDRTINIHLEGDAVVSAIEVLAESGLHSKRR